MNKLIQSHGYTALKSSDIANVKVSAYLHICNLIAREAYNIGRIVLSVGILYSSTKQKRKSTCKTTEATKLDFYDLKNRNLLIKKKANNQLLIKNN